MIKDPFEFIEKYYPGFVKRHQSLWTVLTGLVFGVIVTFTVTNWLIIGPLKEDRQDLQMELLPFKTTALQKFPNFSEEDAFNKLAERIGQIELSVISIFNYQEVATWSFLGAYIKTFGGMTTTGMSAVGNWSDNYVSFTSVGTIDKIECNPAALKHYSDLIQQFEFYPFPYYILALCQQKNKQPEWEATMAKAYKLVSMTTTIPGHHPDHDALLMMITHVKK